MNGAWDRLREEAKERNEREAEVRRKLTIPAGTKVFSSDEAYVGVAREDWYFDPAKPRYDLRLWIRPTPIIGADFTISGTNIASYVLGKDFAMLNVKWTNVLWLASRRFEEMAVAPEPTGVADVGERAIREIRDARRRAEEFRRQMGAMAPEEEQILARHLARRIELIEARFEAELAALTGAN